MCFPNQIHSMRSQSTPRKITGKSWSFCLYVLCYGFFLVSSSFLRSQFCFPSLNRKRTSINAMDKKGGRPFVSKDAAVTELESTIKVHNFVDTRHIVNLHNIGFTWSNPSMKIQSRLDYFFIPKFLQKLIQECRIIPNTFSDHSALILTICFNEETAPRGPGYWKFNNSLLSDNEYIALLRSKIPEFVEKYEEVEDKGIQ